MLRESGHSKIACQSNQNSDLAVNEDLTLSGALYYTLVNVYVDLVVFTRIAGTS